MLRSSRSSTTFARSSMHNVVEKSGRVTEKYLHNFPLSTIRTLSTEIFFSINTQFTLSNMKKIQGISDEILFSTYQTH